MFHTGVVSFAALTDRIHIDAASEGPYALFLLDGRHFYSKTQPRLFDRDRRPVSVRHVPVGSAVKLHTEDGWLLAIQLLEIADGCLSKMVPCELFFGGFALDFAQRRSSIWMRQQERADNHDRAYRGLRGSRSSPPRRVPSDHRQAIALFNETNRANLEVSQWELEVDHIPEWSRQ